MSTSIHRASQLNLSKMFKVRNQRTFVRLSLIKSSGHVRLTCASAPSARANLSLKQGKSCGFVCGSKDVLDFPANRSSWHSPSADALMPAYVTPAQSAYLLMAAPDNETRFGSDSVFDISGAHLARCSGLHSKPARVAPQGL